MIVLGSARRSGPLRLGDLRAEQDPLLDKGAFLETPEYEELIQQPESCVVVGRRGTGKSALFRALKSHFRGVSTCAVVTIAPDNEEILPAKSLVRRLTQHNPSYEQLVTVASSFWRYAMVAEALVDYRRRGGLRAIASNAEGPGATGYDEERWVDQQVLAWSRHGTTALERLFGSVEPFLSSGESTGLVLGKIRRELGLRRLSEFLATVARRERRNYLFLIDRLDEGFEPDDVSVAFINGLVVAAGEFTRSVDDEIRAIVFLRDNIARVLQEKDRDYTRTTEGRLMRLHWDEKSLMAVVARRLRLVSQPSGDPRDLDSTDRQIWDSQVSQELLGMRGFRRVLRATLYRPRDLISLLNEAFREKLRDHASKLNPDHLERSAKQISLNRYNDLLREYNDVIPGLREVVRAICCASTRMTAGEARSALNQLSDTTSSVGLKRTLEIYGTEDAFLRVLHSVGLFGVRRSREESFLFCHDGNITSFDFAEDFELMFHPCYWLALGLSGTSSSQEAGPEIVSEIHDEYGVEVTSVAIDERKRRIRELVGGLARVDIEESGFDRFRGWCRNALRILLSPGVRDLEIAGQPGQLTGRIALQTGFWAELLATHHTRTLVFFIDNSSELRLETVKDAYTQIKGMTTAKVGVIVTRSKEENIRKGAVLDAIRQYVQSGIVLVHVTAERLARSLMKLNDPGRDREAERFLRAAVEQTVYNYMGKRKPARRGQKKQAPRNQAADPKTIQVFICYAHEDKKLRVEVSKAMRVFERRDEIEQWFDENALRGGDKIDPEIRRKLRRADIALLLLSNDFINSEYIWDTELPVLLESSRSKSLRIVPVVVRACLWQRTELGVYKAIPEDGRVVASSNPTEQDEALRRFAVEFESVLRSVRESETQP